MSELYQFYMWLLLNTEKCLCNVGSVSVLSQHVAIVILLQLLILGVL